MAKKKSFTGYISKDWGIEKHNHHGYGSWHECIDIDSNIATPKGMKECSFPEDRIKVRVTIEELPTHNRSKKKHQ